MEQDPYCLAWLGREERLQERLSAATVAALAATFDIEAVPGAGAPLPPGWQWLFFNPVVRQELLGEDGHPVRTPESFLPPIALPRRMWAGSRIRYLAPLAVDAMAERVSRILRITPKEGKSGRMCFVTVEHRIASGGRECIVEEQDIVYREAATGPAPVAPAAEPVPVQAAWQRPITPGTVLLFRYSALTFNGHRIHYDQAYARNVEFYRDLVVHGPLTATLLQDFAVGCMPGRTLCGFEFKGLQPIHVDQPVTLCADALSADSLGLRAVAADGRTAMEATATFA